MKQTSFHASNSTPPPINWQLTPILQKAKDVYILWYKNYKSLPKEHRYTMGAKIDNLLSDIIEAISGASFLTGPDKLPYLKTAVRKTDTIKIFLLLLWETQSLDNKKYSDLSEKIHEIGKMLGGWLGQAIKQNSSTVK